MTGTITKVLAKGFKVGDFTLEIDAKTLIVGANGSGKSACIQAIELALEGKVSGGVHKTNSGIFDAFATANMMAVEVSIGNTALARQFTKNEKGAVSQFLLVDRKRQVEADFARSAAECKAPRVFNVDGFLSMSSEKMISHLATQFGGGDLDAVSSSVETLKSKINAVNAKIKEAENYISRNHQAISEFHLPAGTLAEVQSEIKDTEKQMQEAGADLRRARRAQEKAEQEKKDAAAKAEAEAKAKAEAEKKPAVPYFPDNPHVRAAEQRLLSRAAHSSPPAGLRGEVVETFPAGMSPVQSIQKIIDAIAAVNCPACTGGFALTVAKVEMKKWEFKKVEVKSHG